MDNCGKTCTSYNDCEEGEYCKFDTNNLGTDCSQLSGICQTLPAHTDREITIAGTSIGIWKKGNTALDWWSAKDYCESLGMELPSFSSLCNNVSACLTQATGNRLNNTIRVTGAGAWLDSVSSCQAHSWNPYYGDKINNTNKTSTYYPYCQPVGYTEPNPICPNGQTYNVSSNTCN